MKEKIIKLVELTVEKESLVLKAEYTKQKEPEKSEKLHKKIKAIDEEISVNSNLLKSAGIDFYLLDFDRLIETEKISEHSPEEKAKAIDEKSGELFDLIKTRLQILRENYDHRNELAKALTVISSLDSVEMRTEFLNSIKAKKQMVIKHAEGEKVKRILTIFSRLGLHGPCEDKKFIIQRDVVWLNGETAVKMDEILSGLKALEPQLQWKNAQRQIKNFSEEEENEFSDIQRKYLDLLNARDNLVESYKKEEIVSNS